MSTPNTIREVFYRAVNAVIEQGAPSRNENGECSYLCEDGKKCAIGHLIKDEFYTTELESRSLRDDKVKDALKESIGIEVIGIPLSLSLLLDLQIAHDASGDGDDFISNFKRSVKTIENEWKNVLFPTNNNEKGE